MAEYAQISGNTISRFLSISDQTYQMWVSTNNPKASVYRPVENDIYPEINENQAIDIDYVIQPDKVIRLYIIRNKTADELRKVWTAYEFLLRFTQEERAILRAASANDVLVADFSQLLGAAQEVISDDPVTIQAMDYLVYAEYITNERRNEIMDLPTT